MVDNDNRSYADSITKYKWCFVGGGIVILLLIILVVTMYKRRTSRVY